MINTRIVNLGCDYEQTSNANSLRILAPLIDLPPPSLNFPLNMYIKYQMKYVYYDYKCFK